MLSRKSVIFIIVKVNRFGMVPNTTLSMERDFDSLEYVKDVSSTLVKLYLSSIPLLRV
jgi:hypothetical protein